MLRHLFFTPTFAAFLAAALILAVTPGPGVIYIVTRTLGQGRKAGLASVGGVALGNLANAVVASVGLAAVIAASGTAFVIVKLTGAAYLVFLGVKTLLTKSYAQHAPHPIDSSPTHLFRDGFLVALLNPKTALFFAALLPQFMIPDASPLAQSMILGTVFISIAVCTDTIYVYSASRLASTVGRHFSRRAGRYISAASFIGLGIYAAAAGQRSSR